MCTLQIEKIHSHKGGLSLSQNSDYSALTEAAFYILISLYTPRHGYGVMQTISEISNGRVKLGPGTLYGALNTLLEKNWICSVAADDSSRKKEYVITALGKCAVEAELLRLAELLENGKKIVSGGAL